MANKERERWQFERFCDAIQRPDLKAAVDSEEPDFLFGTRPELGIELADLFSDQAKKGGSETFKNERKFDPFEEMLEAELAQRHPGVGISINLIRKDGTMGGKADVSPAVASAVALIGQALPGLLVDALVPVWDSNDDPRNPLAAFVDRVQVYKHSSKHISKPSSNAPIVGWGLRAVTEPIANLIRGKERLRGERYVKKCARSWLVLVASGTSGSSFIDPGVFDPSATPPTGFERIYIFSQWGRRVILLSGQEAVATTA